MILFELRCGKDHHFEVWFRDNAAYDAQVAAKEIVCPVCGDTSVAKAVMAPRLNKATGQALDAEGQAKTVRKALRELRQAVESRCEHVGERFADEARAIHYGDAEERPIYGEASAQQVSELREEGVPVQNIPWIPAEN